MTHMPFIKQRRCASQPRPLQTPGKIIVTSPSALCYSFLPCLHSRVAEPTIPPRIMLFSSINSIRPFWSCYCIAFATESSWINQDSHVTYPVLLETFLEIKNFIFLVFWQMGYAFTGHRSFLMVALKKGRARCVGEWRGTPKCTETADLLKGCSITFDNRFHVMQLPHRRKRLQVLSFVMSMQLVRTCYTRVPQNACMKAEIKVSLFLEKSFLKSMQSFHNTQLPWAAVVF